MCCTLALQPWQFRNSKVKCAITHLQEESLVEKRRADWTSGDVVGPRHALFFALMLSFFAPITDGLVVNGVRGHVSQRAPRTMMAEKVEMDPAVLDAFQKSTAVSSKYLRIITDLSPQ